MSAIAWQMMDDAGIEITDADPEAAALDRSNQMAFLNSMQRAIEAKKARVGGNGVQQPEAPPRVPTGAGVFGSRTVPDYTAMDDDSLWKEATKSVHK